MKDLSRHLEIIKTDKYEKFCVKGEVDHHTASDIRRRIDSEIFISRPEKVLLDLSGVEFMDSSGLGLILGRYKTATELGCEFALYEPAEAALKILKLAGCDKIIRIIRKKETNEKIG